GNGDGTFRGTSSIPVPALAQNILLGDFNGDGILDLSSVRSIFFGKGDGTFPSSASLPDADFVADAIADFTGSGKLGLLGSVNGRIGLALQPFPATGDFTGTVDPQVLTVRAGTFNAYALNVIPQDGFHSDVNLSVTGLPGFDGGSTPAKFEIFPSTIV